MKAIKNEMCTLCQQKYEIIYVILLLLILQSLDCLAAFHLEMLQAIFIAA
jgi:hypothetical protein